MGNLRIDGYSDLSGERYSLSIINKNNAISKIGELKVRKTPDEIVVMQKKSSDGSLIIAQAWINADCSLDQLKIVGQSGGNELWVGVEKKRSCVKYEQSFGTVRNKGRAPVTVPFYENNTWLYCLPQIMEEKRCATYLVMIPEGPIFANMEVICEGREDVVIGGEYKRCVRYRLRPPESTGAAQYALYLEKDKLLQRYTNGDFVMERLTLPERGRDLC